MAQWKTPPQCKCRALAGQVKTIRRRKLVEILGSAVLTVSHLMCSQSSREREGNSISIKNYPKTQNLESAAYFLFLEVIGKTFSVSARPFRLGLYVVAVQNFENL